MVSFIVIDDSELDSFVARKIIEYTDERLIIQTYNDAQQALGSIRENHVKDSKLSTIILLDLQMPVMNGFQFTEEFEKLPSELRKRYRINILSSTMNQNDISRILSYSVINSFIAKPFTKEKLVALLMQLKLSF